MTYLLTYLFTTFGIIIASQRTSTAPDIATQDNVSPVINHALKAGKKPHVRDKARGPRFKGKAESEHDVEMELDINIANK